ncbi:hypothetical protein ACWEPC_16205 [Nonomuraea sp. NPDC004297]
MMLNIRVVDWTQLQDVFGTADQIPVLLARVEQGADDVAWQELGDRLCHQGETVAPASVAALPALVALARTDLNALDLAGDIVCCAMEHQTDVSLLRDHEGSIAELDGLLDRHLRTRPSYYRTTFRNLLAARGHVRWSKVLGDFTDDFYWVSCPACALDVTVAIGDFGRYSAVRDWHLGDVDRRVLRPARAADLAGPGLWMHDLAVRDGQTKLAAGLTFLFGQAECPRCASVFHVSEAHRSENLPTERLT